MFVLTESSMKLLDFVKALPSDWVLAPILRKGVGGSTGKQPLQESRKRQLGPDDAALIVERNSDISAVGLWTGPKGNGIVIVDADHNDTALRRKYKELADAPRITSPRKNAAKYLFRVPKELWREVTGFGHSQDHNEGFEVLWTNQGLIFGEYPGSEKHKVPEGVYSFHGDTELVPEAPAWLLAMMRAAKGKEGWIKNRAALRLTDRSPELRQQMIFECLSVIPEQGPGSYEMWWRIGMAIHSELPDETGFDMWKMWSLKDPHFDDDWESGKGMPHQKWASFKPDGNITFGTLSYIANQYDPEQTRFSDESKKILEELKLFSPRVDFDELYKRIEASYNNRHLSSGQRKYELLQLAAAADIRNQPIGTLKDIYMSHKESLFKVDGTERTAVDRWDAPEEASYYVPGVFCAGVWLVSGKGGSGKTNACWAIAKHFLSGKALTSEEGALQWEQGNVLWLTGDQPDAVIDDQLKTHLTREECRGLRIENNYDIEDYPAFEVYMREHKPKLVVIDSLRSTSKNLQVSENQSEFAVPLRWYEQMMGDHALFQQCMIIVLHHSGHGRDGARGTSGLNDMTSFAADFKEPGPKDTCNPVTSRLMVFTKHRYGLKGRSLRCTLQDDGTVKLHYLGLQDHNAPATAQDRIRLYLMKNPAKKFTASELADKPTLSCNKDAAKKALQRMVRHGTAQKAGKRGKETLYQANGVAAGWISGASQGSQSAPEPSRESHLVPENEKTQAVTGESTGTSPVPDKDLSHLGDRMDDGFWDAD